MNVYLPKRCHLKKEEKNAILYVYMLCVVLLTLLNLKYIRYNLMSKNIYIFFCSNDKKVSNYKLAKAVGLKVRSRTTDEAYDKAYEHRR